MRVCVRVHACVRACVIVVECLVPLASSGQCLSCDDSVEANAHTHV